MGLPGHSVIRAEEEAQEAEERYPSIALEDTGGDMRAMAEDSIGPGGQDALHQRNVRGKRSVRPARPQVEMEGHHEDVGRGRQRASICLDTREAAVVAEGAG
jgi:hypothetical protein